MPAEDFSDFETHGKQKIFALPEFESKGAFPKTQSPFQKISDWNSISQAPGLPFPKPFALESPNTPKAFAML